MSDGPEWFAPKRYGYGSTPITWQGWAITILFVATVFAIAFRMHGRLSQMIPTLVLVTVAFMVICAKTTRGGWKWRWGEED